MQPFEGMLGHCRGHSHVSRCWIGSVDLEPTRNIFMQCVQLSTFLLNDLVVACDWKVCQAVSMQVYGFYAKMTSPRLN